MHNTVKSENLIQKVFKYGLRNSSIILLRRAGRLFLGKYYRKKHENSPQALPLTSKQIDEIKKEFLDGGITVLPLNISPNEYKLFKQQFPFPNVHNNAVREEKLLEHYIAYKLCGLESEVATQHYAAINEESIRYIDVAGGGSPWADMLRRRGVNAYAVDLNIPAKYQSIDCYRQMNATKMQFADSTVSAMSLQCAYEMFIRNDDILFIDEAKRVLKPGGKVVIVPLYMSMTYGGFSSPEYYGKGYADLGAEEWVRLDLWGIPFSRLYDVESLKKRVISRAIQAGMECTVYVLQDKQSFGEGIYCDFVLQITKPLLN